MSAVQIGTNECCTDKNVMSTPPDDTKVFCLMCGSTYTRAQGTLTCVEKQPYSPFAGLVWGSNIFGK